MKKTGIFYGSSTGNTQTIAKVLSEKLDADIFDVAKNPIDQVDAYENLIFGTSTWGLGDLQDDWDDFLSKLVAKDLQGKKVALFGLGDSASYPDTFVDGIGIIYAELKNKGCVFVGATDTAGYEFDDSQALVDGKFVGLPLDEDNESNLTDSRINDWLGRVTPDFN
jgi:flavodoxin I